MGSPLIVVGDSAFAELAYEYFTHDSDYDVVAFAVERPYLKRGELFGKPVVAVEDVSSLYDPGTHSFYAALVYTQGNRLRARLYRTMKAKGYAAASYISSNAMIWRNAKIGEHCFIFDANVVQPFTEIGDNVVLWSSNHIGHHSRIGSHCFFASSVIIAGFVTVGDYCFFGFHSGVAQNLSVGHKCTIAAGALVLADVPDSRVIGGVWKTPLNATTS